MSIQQQRDLAKTIISHPALSEITERIQQKMFKRFITANDDERKVISDLITSMELFLKEIRAIDVEGEDLDK
ncbi:MAG: hypothetical protein DRJ15_16625 [Bacteroidetes bacterium]|nr:MAG: hypothetical protein DRJ15_16625 [Bacteroidota bacterium]